MLIPRRRPLIAALLVILAGALALTAPGTAQAAPSAAATDAMPPIPFPMPTDIGYYYKNGVTQRTAADGAMALVTIGKPIVSPDASHSLAAIAVRSSDGLNNVQVGWTVDRDLHGDGRPHLFAIYRSGGTDFCYNLCGFEPYDQSTFHLGEALPDGSAKRFIIQHSGDRWWVGYDVTWLGSFPDTLWSGGFVRTAAVQYFGEVSGRTDPRCSGMGTGVWGNDKGSARFTSITLINPATTSPPIVIDSHDPTYTTSQLSGTAFSYGGPGGC